MPSKFGYQCEYCEGMVRAKMLEREAFKHKGGFVILEDVTIGVCDKCGNRYYSAETLSQVAAIATSKTAPERLEPVPAARAR